METHRILAYGVPAAYLSQFARLMRRTERREEDVEVRTLKSLSEKTLREPGSLLLLSFKQPRGTGIQVLRKLRKRNVQIPALLVTSREEMARAMGVEHLGAVDFLPDKNPTAFDLQRALRNLEVFQGLDHQIDELLGRLHRTEDARAQEESRLQELADQLDLLKESVDLAGSPRREYSLRRIDEAIHMAQRYDVPLACLLIGIDDYAAITEQFGNAFADSVLAQIAGRLKRSLRSTDLLTLHGRNEFLVLSPFTTTKGAAALAERLAANISDRPVSYKDQVLRPSASIGVALFQKEMRGPGDLMKHAAKALAKARSSGEKRIEAV